MKHKMILDTLEVLRDAIRAGIGPDRELDARFAQYVLGWRKGLFLPSFTAALPGPGALFAAAREKWPDGTLHVAQTAVSAAARQHQTDNDEAGAYSHPDLRRAIMLAMVEARISELENGR